MNRAAVVFLRRGGFGVDVPSSNGSNDEVDVSLRKVLSEDVREEVERRGRHAGREWCIVTRTAGGRRVPGVVGPPDRLTTGPVGVPICLMRLTVTDDG